MNELPSATFRRQYAKLTEPTRVTVNGHPIGTWTPANPYTTAAEAMVEFGEAMKKMRNAGVSQRQRDDLLHKINRGK